MAKKKVKIFVSYAHRNKQLAMRFIDELKEIMGPSKAFEYEFWSDVVLEVGKPWHQQIQKALDACDVGILCVSPAFLNSKYIKEHELKNLMSQNKVLIPVMLQSIDFNLHDLCGLEAIQIFQLNLPSFSEPRSYNVLRSQRRYDFSMEVFRAIEGRLKSL